MITSTRSIQTLLSSRSIGAETDPKSRAVQAVRVKAAGRPVAYNPRISSPRSARTAAIWATSVSDGLSSAR